MYTWASGNVYKGEYWEDERNGQGRMEWIDGSVYEGEWLNGIQHGFGKMTFPSGKVKEGIFEDNIFKGTAQEQDDDDRTDQNSSSNLEKGETTVISKDISYDDQVFGGDTSAIDNTVTAGSGLNFHEAPRDDGEDGGKMATEAGMTIQSGVEGISKFDGDAEMTKAGKT